MPRFHAPGKPTVTHPPAAARAAIQFRLVRVASCDGSPRFTGGSRLAVSGNDGRSLMVERTIDECLRARMARREQPWRLARPEELARPLAAWLRDELGAGEVRNLV